MAEEKLEFKDISNELSREYHYPGGEKVVIEYPLSLCVRPSGNHRVVDHAGNAYIVKPHWLYIKFTPKAGEVPFSF